MPNIDTTRNSQGALSTSTPALGGGGGDLSGFLQKLAERRMAPQPQQSSVSLDMGVPMRAAPVAPMSMPQMGQASLSDNLQRTRASAPATRMRRVRNRTAIPSFGIDAKGITYDDVEEHQLPDGTWSLDAVHGTLDGNEQAARQKLDILNRDR